MQKLRTPEIFQVFYGTDELRQIMAVQGAYVIKTQFLEQSPRCYHAFHVLFGALG